MYKDCCRQVQYGSAGEETLSVCTAAGWNPLWRHHCGWEHCHPHPGDALYTHLLYYSQSDPEHVKPVCVCVCSGAGWVGLEDWSGIWAGCCETHSPLSAVQPLLGHSALHREPQGTVSLKYIYSCLIKSHFITVYDALHNMFAFGNHL